MPVAKKEEEVVLRVADIGYGYVKYNKVDKDGETTFHSFPSLAPRSSGNDMSSGMLGRRDTVTVDVDGIEYEVGPDSHTLDSNDSTRSLNEQFIFTDQYKALFYGVLNYMDVEEIDLLVLGLPVSGLNLSEKLKKMSIGEFQISKDKKVKIKDVLIVAQPLGGLYHCLSMVDEDERFEFLEEETNLIIDPGFLTFDFLLANGNLIVDNRSDAYPGGISKVLKSIAASISAKHDIKYDNIGAIDKGLARRKLKVNGKKEDLGEHIKNTRSVIENSVNYMRNIVGDGSDIDNIILIGGGSEIFRKTIESFYLKHEIICLEDPQMINIKGFIHAGKVYLEKNKK